MTYRFHPPNTPPENRRSLSGKFVLLVAILIVLAIPIYFYGTRVGNNVMPAATNFFYRISVISPSPTATPLPTLSSILPQAGGLPYTVQDGDSCDEILAFQMRMATAGEIFSDVKPNTVKELDTTLGHDCHALQPGMTLFLLPHYPLVALGGVVLKIDATSPQEVVPTPIIRVPQQQFALDCSGGCLLTVRIAPQVQVRLIVQTALPIRIGSWVWVQAMMAHKTVRGFDNYPYADPNASLNGMTLRVCDFQVDDTHDDDSFSCSQLSPNTIVADGGAWLFAVTGPSALDHWRYPLHLPTGTRLLLWLSDEHGNLVFHRGNPVYRYDDASRMYVKIS